MSVRRYYRHLLGVEVAITFPQERREIKAGFMEWFCAEKDDPDAIELIDKTSKLKSIFNQYKSTNHEKRNH